MLYRQIIIGVSILLLPVMAAAGQWHIAGSLKCGDCHLQHASNQMETPGTAFSYMLKKNSVNELCLSCHDGADQTAPDVVTPIQMYNGTPSQQSGAGHFGIMGFDNETGHAIGIPATMPLQGMSQTMELNCASCHAVHGNNNYRNLAHDPAGTGADISVFEDIDVVTLQKPSDPPTSGATALAYERDNTAYLSEQMDRWCIACHDMLANNATGILPAHFNGHPSNVALNENSFEPHADPAHWVAGAGEGFTIGTGDGIARLPYLAPQANSFITAKIPQATNRVGCISCHKGHGSDNKQGMLWPYIEGGTGYIAGCQQCHNK